MIDLSHEPDSVHALPARLPGASPVFASFGPRRPGALTDVGARPHVERAVHVRPEVLA